MCDGVAGSATSHGVDVCSQTTPVSLLSTESSSAGCETAVVSQAPAGVTSHCRYWVLVTT